MHSATSTAWRWGPSFSGAWEVLAIPFRRGFCCRSLNDYKCYGAMFVWDGPRGIFNFWELGGDMLHSFVSDMLHSFVSDMLHSVVSVNH